MPMNTYASTVAGPSTKPSAESLSWKLVLIRSASIANAVWSKKDRKVARMMTNRA
jgi:hypothetical protein